MKKVVILGAARSGVGAAILAKEQGMEVFVSDFGQIKPEFRERLTDEGIDFEEEGHSMDRILSADAIVKSPGIPEKAPVIKEIRKAGIEILSEIEFGYRFTEAKIIAITGSNGKTTTTSLIWHLMKEAGYDVGLGGNIGHSFALQVAREPHEYYVLELSSFQLDDISTFSPDIAVLLNITPDHLDRYHYEIDRYAAAKLNIAAYQNKKQLLIYNLDDPITMQHIDKLSSPVIKTGFSYDRKDSSSAWMEGTQIQMGASHWDYSKMQLIGRHNALNSMAAIMATKAVGLTDQQIETGLSTFEAIEHRLEPVAEIAGVRWINDSKATNVDAVWYALESMDRPTVWIAGGVDKGNDYSVLTELAKEKVKALVVLGEDKDKFFTVFKPLVKVKQEMTMVAAVETAHELAENGDCVLLSSACASFDLFNNYEDRGRQFKKAALALR